VEVLFPTDKLRRQFSDYRALQRRWGNEGAKKITLRLQQLDGVVTLADLRELPGHCHELTGDRDGYLAIDVHQPYRLIFQPTADPPPTKRDGGLDWNAVESVTVTEIFDYH
jgi:proteic killer suppression protein